MGVVGGAMGMVGGHYGGCVLMIRAMLCRMGAQGMYSCNIDFFKKTFTIKKI